MTVHKTWLFTCSCACGAAGRILNTQFGHRETLTVNVWVPKRPTGGWNVFRVRDHLRHVNVETLNVYVRDWDELPEITPPRPSAS